MLGESYRDAISVFDSPSRVGLVGEQGVLPQCQCILQSQSTGPQNTRWGARGLISLQRCSQCILQSPVDSAEMQSVYSTVPVDWASEHSLGSEGSYLSAEMQSVNSQAPPLPSDMHVHVYAYVCVYGCCAYVCMCQYVGKHVGRIFF